MHCFIDNVDLENPGKDIIVGAGIHDLCADPKVAHEFWQLSHVKKIHRPGNYDIGGFQLLELIITESHDLLKIQVLSLMEILFVKKNPLQDLLSSLNAVISTNERH